MCLLVLGIDMPAGSGLAQEVPAGPGEIADHVSVLGDEPPQVGDPGRERLGTDDDPVRMGLLVQDVAALAVVESDDVEHRGGLDEPLADDR
jgi:hypothetical protein